MNTKLFYFSGTGNSLKIARDIAAELGGAEIIPINRVTDPAHACDNAENIGIVFPVYIWGLPLIVDRFTKSIAVSSSQYVFSVANYGGFQAGTTEQLRKNLKTNNINLSAGFGIKMPGNYTPLYGAPSEEKQAKLFAKEKKKVKYIAESVKNKKKIIEKDFFILKFIFSDFLYRMGSRHIPEIVKDYWVDEKCNSCAICEKVCPVNNIEMSGGKPKWKDHCEQCLACLQWCPREAIQCKKSTVGRKRYRNPDIKANDFYGK